MTRPPHGAEERTLQSLRQANVISKAQMDACLALLVATETCDKCGGDGNASDNPDAPVCDKCDSTGQMYTIR